MNARTLLTLGLLSATPALLFAQPYAEPLEAVIASLTPAPRSPRVPRPAVAPLPMIAAELALSVAPPAPETPQAPPPPTPPRAPATPKAASAPAPVAAPAPPTPPRPLGQMLNVRIDVTLSDSKGSTKTLTMTVADGENGMNRTTSVLPVGQAGGDYSFNADAIPHVVGNRIRLRLTADAVVPVDSERSAPGTGGRLALRQSQTLILNDGDSVEIARAADPVSERAFTLSVKATIQR